MKHYVRMRPAIDEQTLRSCIRHGATASGTEHGILFTSGSGALKWLLTKLSQRMNRRPCVAVQALTCNSVVRAISESECIPAFFDVNDTHFSTSPAALNALDCDIVILTHVYGIPNRFSLEIRDWCRKKRKILIEDAAQCLGGVVEGHDVGTIGDAAFFSYGLDKPLSCNGGGELRINSDFLGFLCEKSTSIPVESKAKARKDLRILLSFYQATDPAIFLPGFSFGWFEQQLARIPGVTINKRYIAFCTSRTVKRMNAIYYRLSAPKPRPLPVRRMNPVKKTYIKHIQKEYSPIQAQRNTTAAMAHEKLASLPFPLRLITLEPGVTPAWYRLPVCVEPEDRPALVRWFAERGIQAGPYLWSRPAFAGFPELERRWTGQVPSTFRIISSIVQVPLWTKEIWTNPWNLPMDSTDASASSLSSVIASAG